MRGTDDGSEVEEKMEEGVEKVESFVYLGDCITAAGGCRRAVTGEGESRMEKV